LSASVLDAAYKEDSTRRKSFRIPDNIRTDESLSSRWSRRDFERLAEVAKEEQERFLYEGFPAASDKRQMRYIQFAEHQRSINYLLQHLDQFPKAKEYGITRADSDVVYMLKVPKRAPDEALETMRKVFEERLNIKVVIRKINW
jgi:hypothetical protein